MKHAILTLCLMALAAAPAAAFEFTQDGSLSFGVIYERDPETGERNLRPGGSAELNLRFSREFDSGVRLEFRFGIEAGDLPRHDRGWLDDGFHHRHHEHW